MTENNTTSATDRPGERVFPILRDDVLKSIPWEMLEPHERQALSNHSQTLKRLAERGGLLPLEAYAVINGLATHMVRWDEENNIKARNWLIAKVKERSPASPPASNED